MERKEKALSYFIREFNCCQSVLVAYARDFGLSDETALSLAGAFGGGIGGTGETCGAVTGGLLVIGLRHGAGDPKDKEGREKIHQAAQAFMARFTAMCGSTRCRDLLGCDVGAPGGRERALALGLFKDLCPRFVESAVQILEDMA